MNIRFALVTVGLCVGAATTPAFAQNNATIAGSASAPGNGSGGPSAATTAGNLATTTFTSNGIVQTPGSSPLAPGSVNTSRNSVAQTPGSPANTGK